MKPYYEDSSVTIYHGDCRELLPTINPSGFTSIPFIDLILTDPPYGIDCNSYKRTLPSTRKWDEIEGDDSLNAVKWLMLNLDIAEYQCVFGASNFPELLPHRGRWLCWDKRLTREADRMLGSAFELAWMNKTHGHYEMFRVLHGGVVNANGGQREHPTEKPVSLFREIIQRIYPNVLTVFDPFCGVGGCLRAAKDLGKKAMGWEIEERYCEIAARRMEQEVLPLNAACPQSEVSTTAELNLK